MTIDIQKEQILSLAGAARWWGEKRGRRCAPSSVWRWAYRGVTVETKQGNVKVKLEVLKDGRRLMTSVEALQRFFDATSGTESAWQPTPPAEYQRRCQAAIDRMKARGA